MILDRWARFDRQRWMYFSSLTVCFSNLLMSMAASWTSPTLAALLQDETSGVGAKEAAILDILLPGGALLGGILGWMLIDCFGRKTGHIFGGIFFFVSWAILGFFRVLVFMYVARFLAGLAVGILYLSSGIYIAEIAPSGIRQVLFAVSQLFTNFGFLIVYLVGPYVSYEELVFISILPVCSYITAVVFIEESPYYLVSRGDNASAKASLERLRGVSEVGIELKSIQESMGHPELCNLKTLLNKQNRRALWLAVGAMVVKQMTGGWALVSYAEPLLEEANVPSRLGSAILGITKLFTSAVTICLTIYYGTKNLVTISLTGIALSLMTLLSVLVVQQNTDINTDSMTWLPLVALVLYFVFTDFGIGPFPSFIGAELFSQQAKGLGTLVALSVGHFFGLLTMALITTVDFVFSLALFAACSTLSIPVIHRYLVETKGKTLSELQDAPPPKEALEEHI